MAFAVLRKQEIPLPVAAELHLLTVMSCSFATLSTACMIKILNLNEEEGFNDCYIFHLSFGNSHRITLSRKNKRQNGYLTSPFELYFLSNDVVAKIGKKTSQEV